MNVLWQKCNWIRKLYFQAKFELALQCFLSYDYYFFSKNISKRFIGIRTFIRYEKNVLSRINVLCGKFIKILSLTVSIFFLHIMVWSNLIFPNVLIEKSGSEIPRFEKNSTKNKKKTPRKFIQSSIVLTNTEQYTKHDMVTSNLLSELFLYMDLSCTLLIGENLVPNHLTQNHLSLLPKSSPGTSFHSILHRSIKPFLVIYLFLCR